MVVVPQVKLLFAVRKSHSRVLVDPGCPAAYPPSADMPGKQQVAQVLWFLPPVGESRL